MKFVKQETSLSIDNLVSGNVYEVVSCNSKCEEGWIGSYVCKTEKCEDSKVFVLASNGKCVKALSYVLASNTNFRQVPSGTKLTFGV